MFELLKEMPKILSAIFLFLSLLINAQQKGEVFPHHSKNPMVRVEEQGSIEVQKTLYGLQFKDNSIPEVYKKAVQRFFKDSLNGYTELKTYHLKIAKKQGYIWIEDKRITKLP